MLYGREENRKKMETTGIDNNDSLEEEEEEEEEEKKIISPIEKRLRDEVSKIVAYVNNRILLRGTDLKEIEFRNFFYANGSYEKALMEIQQKYLNQWSITHCKPSFLYQWNRFKFRSANQTSLFSGWFS